jgi:hypothetical protein
MVDWIEVKLAKLSEGDSIRKTQRLVDALGAIPKSHFMASVRIFADSSKYQFSEFDPHSVFHFDDLKLCEEITNIRLNVIETIHRFHQNQK